MKKSFRDRTIAKGICFLSLLAVLTAQIIYVQPLPAAASDAPADQQAELYKTNSNKTKASKTTGKKTKNKAKTKKKMVKPKLTKKTLTLTVKKSKKLTVKNPGKNRVKWAVKGKKLVTIKASGKKKQKAVIKAGKKAGSCYVVVRVGKKKLVCKVRVKKKKAAAVKPAYPLNPSQEEPDDFKEKSLSSQSRNETAKYSPDKVTVKEPDAGFSNAMADVSVRLLQEIMKKEGTGGRNILISPDSILTALSMAEQGAAGDTLSEMETVLGGESRIAAGDYCSYLAGLHSHLTASGALKYQIANSIWHKEGAVLVKEPFLKDMVSYYGADVYAAPFDTSTVNDINAWAYNKTYGKIPSIINDLSPDARMVIMNAIYFKGLWAEPYTGTVSRTFTREDGNRKNVPMLEGTETTYVNVKGAEGFVKPYQGGAAAFMGILPPAGTSIDAFVKGLKGSDLMEAYAKRQTSLIKVHTRMPEFTYDYDVSLADPLRAMGMKKAFTDEADFSAMAAPSLCIDQVLHKTHIDLNKEGTEAAAVTAIIAKASAYIDPNEYTHKYVYLDRPFVYAIIDTRTGLPLFLGVVKGI